MLHWLVELYGPFFSLHAWENVVTSGADWAIIFSLIMIECLLSVDNAVVLAAQTQKLPTLRQKEKALIYGLWGSYVMRFLMIG
ncbi:MAG: TerC family protein, partial [Loigolactobacillus coryniformis]